MKTLVYEREKQKEKEIERDKLIKEIDDLLLSLSSYKSKIVNSKNK